MLASVTSMRPRALVVKAGLFDTNILIDYLNADGDALTTLDFYDRLYTSVIVRMEVLVGAVDAIEMASAGVLFKIFEVLPMTDAIERLAIVVRQRTHAKLPDAIIHATAIHHRLEIVTRNPGDFKALPEVDLASLGLSNVPVVVPYRR